MTEQLDMYRFIRKYADAREAAGAASRLVSGNEALHYHDALEKSALTAATKQQVMHEVIRLGGLTAVPLDLISLAPIGAPLPLMLTDPIIAQEESIMNDNIEPEDSDEYDITEVFPGNSDWMQDQPSQGSLSPTTLLLATRILGMTYEEMCEFVEDAPGNQTALQWLSWAKQKV